MMLFDVQNPWSVSKQVQNLIKKFPIYLCLGIGTFTVLVPLAIIFSSAFKPEYQIFDYPISWVPKEITLTNFVKLQQGTTNFILYIFNSFKVTILTVIVQVFTSTTAGYAFSKLYWKGRDYIFLLYIGTMMIPIQVYIIPQFIIVKNLGLYDSHLALILVNSFTAFGIFLIKQFFMMIPDSLLEAARIDGANDLVIFRRIMLPLSGPVIATLVIFSFRYFWNDFFGPLIYLTSPDLKTLALGMADFVGQYFIYYGPQMAASLVSIVPLLVLFLFAQKYIIQGVAATGLKG